MTEQDTRFAAGIETIQVSKLALAPSQLDCLRRNGVVIAYDRPFDSFVVGYVDLYAADLPLFVSADSILHALHRTHEDFLASIETSVLAPALDAMLTALRDNLEHASGAWSREARADVDLYLTIALRLLRGEFRAGEGGAPPAFIDDAGGESWKAPRTDPAAGRARADHAGRVMITGTLCEWKNEVFARAPGTTDTVVLSTTATLTILDDVGRVLETFVVPHGATILCKPESLVARRDVLADWDKYSQPMLAQVDGRLVWEGLIRDRTFHEFVDDVTGLSRRLVLPLPDGDVAPTLALVDEAGRVLTVPGTDEPARQPLLERTHLLFDDGAIVRQGDVLARIPLYPPPPARDDEDVGSASVGPVAGGSPERIAQVMQTLRANDGVRMVELFGTTRPIDTSQIAASDEAHGGQSREAYFRTLRWLNAVSFHLVLEQPDGRLAVSRRQIEAAGLLRALLAGKARTQWDLIAQLVHAFAGAFDNATLFELDAVCARIGVRDVSELAAADVDAQIGAFMAIAAGRERIQGEPIGIPTPIAKCWLFGACFSLDALVLHHVVHNRIAARRMMPSPLDVGYAALANEEARLLLREDLARHGYATELERVRRVVDAEIASDGAPSLYNRWLAALRALSTSNPGGDREPLDAPRMTAWNRRVLNTQLASWSELRHATRLYAKQSRSWGIICSFPDAYVEPCPAFFSALIDWAQTGRQLAHSIEPVAPRLAAEMTAYFARLMETSTLLGEIASRQVEGLPLTPEQLRFINQAVTLRPRESCAPLEADGWFPMLYREAHAGTVPGYPVTAVHTSDLDDSGKMVGNVLHVGTGAPRFMVMTVSTPNGPRAYAGLVSSFHERITHNYESLGGSWQRIMTVAPPPPTSWLADVAIGEASPTKRYGEEREEFLRDETGIYRLVLAPDRQPAYGMGLISFPDDVHHPVSDVVIARAGEFFDDALDRVRSGGVRAIRVPSSLLLGGIVADEIRDLDGTLVAASGALVDAGLLERLYRSSVDRVALRFG